MNPITLAEAENWARYWIFNLDGRTPLQPLLNEYEARGKEIEILSEQLHQLLDSQAAAINSINKLTDTLNKLDQPINNLKQIVAADNAD